MHKTKAYEQRSPREKKGTKRNKKIGVKKKKSKNIHKKKKENKENLRN